MSNQSPTASGQAQYAASPSEEEFDAPSDGTKGDVVPFPRGGVAVGQAEEEDATADESDDFDDDDGDEADDEETDEEETS